MKNKKIKAEGKQVGKFGLIGVANTVIDFTFYNLMILLVGFSAVPANVVSTTIAMTFSFVANKTFVFGSTSKKVISQALAFLLVTAFGLYVIQNGVIYLLLEVWQYPLELAYYAVSLVGLDAFLSENVVYVNGAKALATLFSLSWNYLMYRNVVFSKNSNTTIERVGDFLAEYRDGVFLVTIVAIAAFFRFWGLDTLPPGLHPDEAANGLDALRILGGQIQPFYEANNGREGLFFMLQAGSISVLGNTMLALRAVPAVIGLAAVVMTYLASKAWFSTRVALIASFIVASAPWAVHMSRLGFRASLLMFFIPLIMWLAAKALQTNKAAWFVATGVATGLGFYTYISFRAVPILALILLGFAWWRYRDQAKALVQPGIIVLLSAFLTVLPLGIYAATNYDAVFGRGNDVSVFNPEYNHGDLAGTVVKVAAKTAGMFHIMGDYNYRHNLGGEPQLNPFEGILFILGFVLLVRRWRDIRYAALLAIFLVMLLPALATAEGIPHALRSIGVVPVVYIIAAIGLSELLVRWKGVFPFNPVAYYAAALTVLFVAILSVTYNYQRYFVAWANSVQTYEAHNENLYLAANHLIENEIEGKYYVVIDGYNDMPIRYLTDGKREYEQIHPDQSRTINLEEGDVIIEPHVVSNRTLIFNDEHGLVANEHHSPKRPHVSVYTMYERE